MFVSFERTRPGSMNNKYGCVNDSGLEWGGRYLALFSLSTVSGYGGGKKMYKERNSDDRFRPIFFPNYTGVFSQLNCF